MKIIRCISLALLFTSLALGEAPTTQSTTLDLSTPAKQQEFTDQFKLHAPPDLIKAKCTTGIDQEWLDSNVKAYYNTIPKGPIKIVAKCGFVWGNKDNTCIIFRTQYIVQDGILDGNIVLSTFLPASNKDILAHLQMDMQENNYLITGDITSVSGEIGLLKLDNPNDHPQFSFIIKNANFKQIPKLAVANPAPVYNGNPGGMAGPPTRSPKSRK